MRSSLTNTEIGGPSLSLGYSSRLGRSVVSQANGPLSFRVVVSPVMAPISLAQFFAVGLFTCRRNKTASGDTFRINTLTFIVWVLR